jgi:hypothetical protein
VQREEIMQHTLHRSIFALPVICAKVIVSVPVAILAALCIVWSFGGAAAQSPGDGEMSAPEAAVARVPYQATRSKACVASPCQINFPIVLAKRRLEIAYVSCSAVTPVGSSPLDAELSTNSNKVVHVLQPVPTDIDISGNKLRRWTHPIFMFVPAGQKATVTIFSTGSFASVETCTLSGHMVALS